MQARSMMSLGIALTLVFFARPARMTCFAQESGKDALPRPARPPDNAQCDIPEWVHDARWYQVVVPRFQNGDPSNDGPETLSWTTDWPVADQSQSVEPAALDARAYGGDLQGLEHRLPYLKELGVNALCLTHIFSGSMAGRDAKLDLRHIDDGLGVKGSLANVTGETDDPATWKFSDSDRVFLNFLKVAHKQGFHVVVGVVVDEAADGSRRDLVARRWMDPNRDGDPSEGVDGWLLQELRRSDPMFSKAWGKRIKTINPRAVLIGDLADNRAPANRPEFDVLIGQEIGDAIMRFFVDTKAAYRLGDFFNDLTTGCARDRFGRDSAVITPLGGPRDGRLRSALTKSAAKPGRQAWDRAQLATVVQHFVGGAPLTYYGEEAGMYGGKGPLSRAPMWWSGQQDTQSKAADCRGDFAALVQWLHARRGMDHPLRHGRLRPIMQDEERRLFAFARTLPGDKVVLVVNYGRTKHKVVLQAGKPGQLAGVLSPQFGRLASWKERGRQSNGSAQAHIRSLWVGGSRQYVDAGGHIRLWVTPMSVRVVLLHDSR